MNFILKFFIGKVFFTVSVIKFCYCLIEFLSSFVMIHVWKEIWIGNWILYRDPSGYFLLAQHNSNFEKSYKNIFMIMFLCGINNRNELNDISFFLFAYFCQYTAFFCMWNIWCAKHVKGNWPYFWGWNERYLWQKKNVIDFMVERILVCPTLPWKIFIFFCLRRFF